eukprot:Hpha_TRINITY_DN16461_c2_g11::TRINITY_DN16461_c2_g11_i1::g.160037::m.160037
MEPAAASAAVEIDPVAKLVRDTLDALCREVKEHHKKRHPGLRSAEPSIVQLTEKALEVPLEKSDAEAVAMLQELGWPRGWSVGSVRECQRTMLRTLLTVLSFDPSERVLGMMDEVLRAELTRTTVTRCADLFEGMPEDAPRVVVWRGDICLLDTDGIVNACNNRMLGCMRPMHPCIDNAIHCGAGPRLRKECREFMAESGNEPEPTGQARITPGYCLPCKHVLHTVGPIAHFKGHQQPELLSSCYKECLDQAAANDCRSIAFCCLSTGVFGYPQGPACVVALKTVAEWLKQNGAGSMSIVFNVFKREDLEIYAELTKQVFPGARVVDALGEYNPPST